MPPRVMRVPTRRNPSPSLDTSLSLSTRRYALARALLGDEEKHTRRDAARFLLSRISQPRLRSMAPTAHGRFSEAGLSKNLSAAARAPSTMSGSTACPLTAKTAPRASARRVASTAARGGAAPAKYHPVHKEHRFCVCMCVCAGCSMRQLSRCSRASARRKRKRGRTPRPSRSTISSSYNPATPLDDPCRTPPHLLGSVRHTRARLKETAYMVRCKNYIAAQVDHTAARLKTVQGSHHGSELQEAQAKSHGAKTKSKSRSSQAWAAPFSMFFANRQIL